MDKNIKWMLLKAVLGLAIFIFLLSFAQIRQGNRTISGVDLNIDHVEGLYFVQEESLMKDLKNKYAEYDQESLKSLNIKRIEQLLNDDPFVERAEVYRNVDGNLEIQIVQEKPFARVNSGENEFYISETLEKMPLSSVYSPEVMIVGGNIKESDFEGLKELILFIKADKLLTKHIIAIKKQAPNSFILLVNKGNYIIEFGDLKGIEEKFDHLKLFYEQYLGKVGLDYYEKINLKFKNQIVATKRKNDEKE